MKKVFREVIGFLASQSHGEIFLEFYHESMAVKMTIPQFVEELKEDLMMIAELEGEDYGGEVLNLISSGRNEEAIIAYFEENPSHGEVCGSAIAACENSDNPGLAKKIANLCDGGFDS